MGERYKNILIKQQIKFWMAALLLSRLIWGLTVFSRLSADLGERTPLHTREQKTSSGSDSGASWAALATGYPHIIQRFTDCGFYRKATGTKQKTGILEIFAYWLHIPLAQLPATYHTWKDFMLQYRKSTPCNIAFRAIFWGKMDICQCIKFYFINKE